MNILIIFLFGATVSQWTTEDLALYDLVEEVGQNFYEVFEIEQDAPLSKVKSVYRKLTLKWHPDRNSAPEATQKFRQVVGIYDVLKSAELREKYNNILENGLPSWRQPLYYYRRMRKLAWYEAVLVLLFVSTIAHYLMMWASYFEKTLEYKQNVKKIKKKKDGEKLAEIAMNEALKEFEPKPLELLPFMLMRRSVQLGFDLIVVLKYLMRKKEQEIEDENEEEDKRPVKRSAPSAPKVEYKFEVAKNLKAVSTNDPEMEKKYKAESEVIAKKQAGSSWTPDELAHLVKLSTEKYPAGTPNRWEQIGRALNRSDDDVIAMAGKLKQMKQEDYTRLLMTTIQQSKPKEEEEVKNEEEWTQEEQKAFEMALQKYPKGTDERWDRIAEFIGTKNKKQVVARFKKLAELVKKKRAEC